MRISDWSSDVCSSDLVALAVDGDLLAGRQSPDMLGLILLADGCEVADRLVALPDLAGDRLVTVDDLVHALLDEREVVGREGLAPGEIVVEAVFDGRSRSEEHTSELQSLMRISYAVFCLKKKTYK